MDYKKIAEKFLDPDQHGKSAVEIIRELSAQPGFSHLDLARTISSMVNESMKKLDAGLRELRSFIAGRGLTTAEVETDILERR
jgi:hypothetical protein